MSDQNQQGQQVAGDDAGTKEEEKPQTIRVTGSQYNTSLNPEVSDD